MAQSKYNSMWRIMSDYELDFSADSSYKVLLCTICNKVMVNAVHSNVCGCQYCYKCISEYTNGEERYCPGGKEDCKDEHMVLDRNIVKHAPLNKTVSKLKVKCPNECCECYLELIDLETHLRLCTKRPMECPYAAIGCFNDKVNNETIITHLHGDTMTHSELLMECIKQLMNEVRGLKEDYAFVQEELRTKEDRITKLEKEIKDVSEKNESEIAAVMGELLNKETKIMALEKELREMELRINGERNVIKEEVNNLKLQIEEARIAKETKRMTNARAGSELEMDNNNATNKLYSNIDANFVWKIDEFSKKMKNYTSIYSESFRYNNYKLCLYLYINGGSDNIGLWCCIMVGDNDNNERWPMKRSISVNIIDQFTLRTFKSETYQSNFSKPNKDRDECVGSYKFVKYSSIKDKLSIIYNDSIIVSIVVSPL